MATYVLCHGGWAGGWQWEDVRALLESAGHRVFTPTLTGLGERGHLAHPDIDLDTYIQDILMVLKYAVLQDVILLGYSLRGPVISGVAEKVPGKIRHLVYLDAYVLEDGQAISDQIAPEVMSGIVAAAEQYGDGWRLPHDPPDADRRTDQMLKPILTPLEISNPQASSIPRTFILCTQGGQDIGPLHIPIENAAAKAKHDTAWHYRELATGHMPMWTAPGELVRFLQELA